MPHLIPQARNAPAETVSFQLATPGLLAVFAEDDGTVRHVYALQDAGIVPGDDARYVIEHPVQLVYDTGPRRAWLVVEATDRPETEETPK